MYRFILLLLFLLPATAMAGGYPQHFMATAATGGAGLAMDAIDGNGGGTILPLADGDTCHVVNVSGTDYNYCLYTIDADLDVSESSESICPKYVRPDSNPGTKVWCLTNHRKTSSLGRIDFSYGALNCDTDNDGSCSESEQARWDTGVTYLLFGKAQDEECQTVSQVLPDNFDTTADTVSVQIVWHSGTTGSVMWCFKFQHSSFGEGWSGWSSGQCLDSASSGTADYKNTASVTITETEVDNWDPGDLIQIKIYRDVDGTGDNLNADASIDNVILKFNTIP